MSLHSEHAALARVCVPCHAGHITYGGRCLNCGFDPNPCPRTLALWKPGEKIEGVQHRPSWSGKVPCTGRLRCLLCGQDL